MKKGITFVLFLLCSLNLFAQLNRTVYGISLGQKENNVIQRMVDKNLTIETTDSQHGKLISGKGDIIFAGETWDAVSVSIRNGKVYGILFLKEKEYDEGRELIQTFSSLVLSLVEKYPEYAQEPISKKYSYGIDNTVLFIDEVTNIAITMKLRPESTSSLTLGYVDSHEFDAHSNEAANEL